MTELEKNKLIGIEELFFNNEFSTEALVELIKLIEIYFNPISIQEYADKFKMSYPGVQKYRKQVTFFRKQFIIDNE